MLLRKPLRTFATLALILVAGLAVTTSAGSAAKFKNVFWVDLATQAKQAPKIVFFTANSGGQVHSIKWKNWGGKKAVGRGKYRDTSADYPGKLNQNGPAKLVATKPVKCTSDFGKQVGKNIRVYRHVKLIYPNGRGGRTKADVTATAGWLTCKQSN